MILGIDVGNTSLKAAVLAGHAVARRITLPGDANAVALERALRRLIGRDTVTAAAVSSVNHNVTARVARAVRRVTGVDAIVVSHRAALPIRIAVERPETLGADRICGAAGAVGGRRRHAIVADIGSAVTVDLVVDRVFRGGVIMPGPAMALRAMHAYTDALPDLEFRGPGPRLGIDRTDRSMRWGAGLAVAGGIEAAADELARRAGLKPARILTGGHAPAIAPLLGRGWRLEPDLTLVGLSRVAGANRERRG